MTNLDINKATISDYENNPEYQSTTDEMDSPLDQKETEWQNTNWTTQYGYFTSVPELQNAFLMKGIWNTGKGWVANADNQAILDNIKGWGKDTFDDIIFNMDVMSMVAGDSFAEIIRDKKGLLNLKPLNPGTIKIVSNREGMITRYEQIVKKNDKDTLYKTWKPHELFDLCYNRMGDQVHGISKVDAIEPIIKADEEMFEITKKVMKQQAIPFVIYKLKTDDQATIDAFITKIRNIKNTQNDLFIPDDENLLSWEVVQINPSQLILQWRDDLRNKFYRAVGLPQIVPGGGTANADSDARVIYLAFEHLVLQRQRYLEKQIFTQLGIEIKFNSPTTMAELIGKDESKDAGGQLGAQKSEVNPGSLKQ